MRGYVLFQCPLGHFHRPTVCQEGPPYKRAPLKTDAKRIPFPGILPQASGSSDHIDPDTLSYFPDVPVDLRMEKILTRDPRLEVI